MLQNLSLDKNDTPSSVATHHSAVRRRAPRAPTMAAAAEIATFLFLLPSPRCRGRRGGRSKPD
eukprot:994901-Prymnesium_polylepis.1